MGEPGHTDVIVIGMGPGGEYAADALAGTGLHVIAIEDRLVGGECPWNDKVAADRFTGKGGHLVRGRGTITGPGEVTVGAQVFRAIEDALRSLEGSS